MRPAPQPQHPGAVHRVAIAHPGAGEIGAQYVVEDLLGAPADDVQHRVAAAKHPQPQQFGPLGPGRLVDVRQNVLLDLLGELMLQWRHAAPGLLPGLIDQRG